jgi:hypothetical protein
MPSATEPAAAKSAEEPDLDYDIDDVEQEKRASMPGGALSPGTTATGSPTGRGLAHHEHPDATGS